MRNFLFILPLILLCILAISAPLIAPYPINFINLAEVKLPPSSLHLMGTDLLGRDVLTNLLYSLQNSLLISLFASFLSLVFALLFVSIAHLWAYTFFMRILDMFLAIPSLILIMFFQSFLQGNIATISVLIALSNWVYAAKILENTFSTTKNLDFYTCSLVLGASKYKALLTEILPSCKNLIFILFILNIAHSIGHESILSFFGLGVPVGEFSLGVLLSDAGKGVFLGAWWLILFPALTLLLLILPLLALANSLQDRLGVKL